jgi:hypothetical protein
VTRITRLTVQTGSRSLVIQASSLPPPASGALRFVIMIAMTRPAMMMLEMKLCATVRVNGALET